MTRLGRYYDRLGRFQRFARWVGQSGYQTLAIHRRLDAGRTGVSPQDVVHEKLLTAVGSVSQPRVIDAGCGLGGTVFYLHSRIGGRYDGLTLSLTQRARAVKEATRRGVAETCRFHMRSYDGDLHDLVPGGADLVIAIESLAHATDPARTVGHLARILRPEGCLVVVDDMPGDTLADGDPDFDAFKRDWAVPFLARGAGLETAFRSAGLELACDEDLTPLVVLRDARALERRIRIVRGLARLLGTTAAGEFVASFTEASCLSGSMHGGLCGTGCSWGEGHASAATQRQDMHDLRAALVFRLSAPHATRSDAKLLECATPVRISSSLWKMPRSRLMLRLSTL